MNKRMFDIIIVGSGIAGTYLANLLSTKLKIAIVSKRNLAFNNSSYAQGGIAAVLAKTDSFQKHIQDTLIAGGKMNNRQAVTKLVREAPAQIQQLMSWGVQFDRTNLINQDLDLTREGGHSERRIVHVGDLTGKVVEQVLLKRLRQLPTITYFEHHLSIDLIKTDQRVVGVTMLDHSTHQLKHVYAKTVVLATGGCGQVYQYTTNPIITTGDGIAMALRAGAKVQDMEFIQFHPTALNTKRQPLFLLSEALRGEGAVLKNSAGKRFMQRYHSQAELAPRDIVSRAIVHALKTGPVYLDFSHKPKSYLQQRFPTVFKQLRRVGFKLESDQIPIIPAAHYLCGGITTDLFGRTNLSGLYAIGEVARTGAQGANRLASNSLLECLVFAKRASENILQEFTTKPFQAPKSFKGSLPQILPCKELGSRRVWILRKKIQKIMWSKVGIIRTETGLNEANMQLAAIQPALQQLQRNGLTYQLQETLNIFIVARTIVQQALARKKSVGAHYVSYSKA